MKKVLAFLLLIVIATSMVIAGCAQPAPAPAPAPEPEPKPTIVLTDLNWGSARFGAELAKILIEEGYGYPVEFVSGATIPMFQGVRTGDIDVYMEGWLQNQQEAYDEATAAGDIVVLSWMNDDNWQSAFVVPTYVIEGDPDRGIEPMAPNLKTVFDLELPEHKELFQNPENKKKGMLMNGPPGWECEILTIEQVEVYGLADDYDVINAGSQEGLFASLAGAYEKGEPWLGYLWGPTWIAGKLDLTLLEEPAFDQAVWDDNHATAYPAVDLFIAANKDFPDKAPDVTEMFKKWKLDTATLDEVLSYMDKSGGEPVDAAIWFLKNKEDIWTTFVPSDIAEKVKEAVAQM